MKEKKILCPYCENPQCDHACSEVVIPNWVVVLIIGAAIALMTYNLC